MQLIPAYKGAQKYPFYLLLKKEFTKNILNSFPRFDATNPEIISSSEVHIVGGWKLVIDVSCWTDDKKKIMYLFQSYTTMFLLTSYDVADYVTTLSLAACRVLSRCDK